MDLTPLLDQTETNLSREDVSRVIHNYFDSWSNKDPALRKSLFHNDAIMDDPVNAQRFEGIQSITEFWAGAEENGVRIQADLHNIIICGQEALAEFTLTLVPTEGGGVRLRVSEIFKLNDLGKITSLRAFWDKGCIQPL